MKMRSYTVIIYDVRKIESPVKLEEFVISADNKDDAVDRAHSIADKNFGEFNKLVKIVEESDCEIC